MARLRVGIVGAGSVADLHAKGYVDEARAHIVAVCDRDEDRAIRRALDWGARSYYTNFSDMLNGAEIDAVEILTPHHLHAPQALEAMRSDIHISIERPMGISIEQADALIHASQKVGKVLQIYEPCLYYKPLLDARNLIDAGEIGQATGIQFSVTVGRGQSEVWNFATGEDSAWRFDPKLAGGSPLLFDVGYQAFCIAMFLVGSVEKVAVWQSETAVNDTWKLDAPTVAMWKHYQQECFGSLSMVYAPERKMRTAYYPLEIQVTVTGTRGDVQVVRSSDPTLLDSAVELRRGNRKVSYGQKNTAFEDSFVRATKNFIGACLGQEEPLLRPQEAKQLLVLTLAYFEAHKRGQAITLQHG